MKKLVFRATRGKALIFYQDYIIDNRHKSVYIVLFQDGIQVRERITKICDSFMGQRFDVPDL